jgi:hypothetical protein
MPGFSFNETMQGTWTRPGESDEHGISFTITARANSWLKHLRDRKATLEGTLRMDGFASGVPISGELIIDPVIGRLIRYTFEFTGDDGKSYRFEGQKDVSLSDVVGTMTTLPATITERSGQLAAQALLKFDTKDLPGFLASFRPRF